MARFTESVAIRNPGDVTLPITEVVFNVPGCSRAFLAMAFQTANAANSVVLAESDDGATPTPINSTVVNGMQRIYVDIELRKQYLHVQPVGNPGDWVEVNVYGDECRTTPVQQTEQLHIARDCA